MLLAEHRHHQTPPAKESQSGDNDEQIKLSDNVASWQSSGKTIEEHQAVVHKQPETQRVEKIDDDEDDDDDEEEDSFTYPSSDEEEVDENKQKWVAKRLPDIAQPNVNNQVSNSNKVNINNTNKNVYEGNVVIHQTFISSVPNGVGNHDGIDVAPVQKITDKDPEAAVSRSPKLSNVSSHPLYPFEKEPVDMKCRRKRDARRMIKHRRRYYRVQSRNYTVGRHCAMYSNHDEADLHTHLLRDEMSEMVSSWCTKRRLIIISGAVLVGIALIVLLVYLLTPGTNKKIPHVPSPPNDTSINNGESFILGVPYVDRKRWVAQPPQNKLAKLAEYPPPYVIISHTATDFCYDRGECVHHVRYIQNFHIESKGWDDIAYNFLVGGDGAIYEGRGWDVEGAHTFNFNKKSIGITFIGTFTKQVPTDVQLFAAKKLIEYALQNEKIAENYKLLGHRQCIKTESPGEKLYNIIKTWPHWAPVP